MRAEILSDVTGLEAEWWDLWRRDPAASVFQSPAWLIPWREQFSESESRILIIRQGGQLTALLPLFKHRGRLLPWGAGTSDWLDGVFAPELDASQLSDGLKALAEPLDLFQIRSGSPLLEAPLPAGWFQRCRPSEPCLEIALPARLPRNMVQNLRYYRGRASKAGVAAPEKVRPEFFEELVELHGRRWRARGQSGVLDDPRVVAWHRATLPILEAAGLVRFYAVRLHGRIVAALYVLLSKRRASYYIGGFAPEFESLGLGTILIGHAVAEAEREGAHVFDFLRGQEPYKYRWGAADRLTFGRLLYPAPR
jgi:CelD/BcsL family acetyltransferase involved in cellulose biosynthesis